MGVIGLAGAVADPQHVAGGGVPVAARRIDPGQRLLIAEQQRLMAREEFGRAQLRRRIGIDAAGAHEAQSFGDAVSQRLITLPGRTVLQETKRPLMDMFKIGVTALGERAQKVKRGGRLPVGHDLAFGIGTARRCRCGEIIDNITPVDR